MGCHCSKARTRKLRTAESRRRHLGQSLLIKEKNANVPNDIEIIQEYVDTGKGHLISTKCYRPKSDKKQKQLKGMIFYCQGYGSYNDWTDMDVALEFTNRGYIVISHDHYGHGRSDGDWLTNPKLSHETYVDDAVFIYERAKRKFTPIQYIEKRQKFHYFLLGHSLGGAVAIEVSKRYTSSKYCGAVQKVLGKDNYLSTEYEPDVNEKSTLKEDEQTNPNDYAPADAVEQHHCVCSTDKYDDTLFGFDGMILSAPMAKIKDELKPPSFLMSFGLWVESLCPDARLVPTKSLLQFLTRDKEYFDMVQQSPLLYDDKPALRTGFVLLKFTEHIEKEMDKIRIPMLIMHGAADQVTDPTMSQILYDRCSCKDKEIKMIDGAWHALFIDTCREDVFDTADEWITQRIQ